MCGPSRERRVLCLPATPARSIAVPRVLNGVGPRTRAERSGGRSTSPASPLAAPVSRLGGFWVAGGGVGAGWRRRHGAVGAARRDLQAAVGRARRRAAADV